MEKRILTIGGSDPFAGGGIQSDLKTFENYGLFGFSALTSVGALDTAGEFRLTALPATLVSAQLATVAQASHLDAIKIGLLYDLENIKVVADFLHEHPEIPVVLDPVIAFKETNEESNLEYITAMKKYLFPLAAIVTPNLREAQLLAMNQEIDSLDSMRATAKELLKHGSKSVIIKGGDRLAGDQAIDIFTNETTIEILSRDKINTTTVNGAGCTFASAIAANLALGMDTHQAIHDAKSYVYYCIQHGVMMNDGFGSVWSTGTSWKRSDKFDE